jgi:hypothetical protein
VVCKVVVDLAVVPVLAQLFADAKFVVGVDGDVAAIEEPMDIGAKQQAIVDLVRALLRVGPDVCSLQNR